LQQAVKENKTKTTEHFTSRCVAHDNTIYTNDHFTLNKQRRQQNKDFTYALQWCFNTKVAALPQPLCSALSLFTTSGNLEAIRRRLWTVASAGRGVVVTDWLQSNYSFPSDSLLLADHSTLVICFQSSVFMPRPACELLPQPS
jgi:hypothetical protein